MIQKRKIEKAFLALEYGIMRWVADEGPHLSVVL